MHEAKIDRIKRTDNSIIIIEYFSICLCLSQ